MANNIRICSKCGREFKVDNPKSRRRVCNSCKARSRRRSGGGGGGKRIFSAALVLARISAPGGGASGVAVNTDFYRERNAPTEEVAA